MWENNIKADLKYYGTEEGEILGCTGEGIEGISDVNCWKVFE